MNTINELHSSHIMAGILAYFIKCGLTIPDFNDAMKFTLTEIGEVYEVDLARNTKGYTRNNPENKPTFSKENLGYELGDAIMMLMLAGYAEGVNPLSYLQEKIRLKLKAFSNLQEDIPNV